jgi:protein O-GlcNAc transferase
MIFRLLRMFLSRGRLPTRPVLVEAQAPTATPVQLLVEQGQLAQAQGLFDDAVRLFRAAVALDSTSADAQVNLGNALNTGGHVADAVAAYERAIALDPQHASARYNLGLVLLERLNPRAEALFQDAVRLRDAFPLAWVALGLSMENRGDLVAAMASYRKAIQLQPDFAGAYGNLGSALQQMGEHDAAIDATKRARDLDATCAGAHDHLLFAVNYHPDMEAQDVYRAYREFDNLFGLPARAHWRAHANTFDPDRRLKVGYVSPDFRRHSARHFFEPLLCNHDKRAFEVFAYAEVSAEDEVTKRCRSYVDHWMRTLGLSDAALTERIRSDGIDILVDLAGHTTSNRLDAFARKPAPVSLSWLGFGYTTGLSAIDYLLTDEACAPVGSEELFSEQPWRLATPGFAYRPADGMGEVSASPALERDFVTFGTLTRAIRVNHRTIKVWSQILRRIPRSRLVVDSGSYQHPSMCAALLEKFSAHGIGPERLQIGFHTPPWDVLRDIDIGLDCFPHNSGTTLFETLYMGLPFVTLAGRPSVGRLGSSILHGVGHPEWIAHSEDEYVEKCVALAADLPALAALRAGLRDQMRASALMDEAGFARKVEAAYREMFARWIAVGKIVRAERSQTSKPRSDNSERL